MVALVDKDVRTAGIRGAEHAIAIRGTTRVGPPIFAESVVTRGRDRTAALTGMGCPPRSESDDVFRLLEL